MRGIDYATLPKYDTRRTAQLEIEKFTKGVAVITKTFSFSQIVNPSLKRIVPSLMALLLSICVLQPTPGQVKSSSGADSIKIPFESYKLPNGLTVILSVDRAIPTVAVD